MFLIPKNNATKELALNLENGLLAGQGSELYVSAHHQLDFYINKIVQSIYSNNQFKPLVPSFFNTFSNTHLWAICYLGLSTELDLFKGEQSYPVVSAIETFRTEHPEYTIPEQISIVDLANIIFSTDYDLVFAVKGIEHIIRIISSQNSSN